MGRGKNRTPAFIPISDAKDRFRSGPRLVSETDLPKKAPQEWAEGDGIVILDPDGWRGDGAPMFGEPCTREEYDRRVRSCTIGPLETPPRKGRVSPLAT